MKFELLDKILHFEPGRIVAIKNVALAEEYLADHFPTFPVLPGVLMLEAAVQACSWLVLHSMGFERPVVVLKEARNIKYGHFVAPGRTLRIEADVIQLTEKGGTFKVAGFVNTDDSGAQGGGNGGRNGGGEKTAFTARLELSALRLGEAQPGLAHLDEPLRNHAKSRWEVLGALIGPPSSAKVAI